MIFILLAFVLGALLGGEILCIVLRRRDAAMVAEIERALEHCDRQIQWCALRIVRRHTGARLETAAARASGHATHPTDEVGA